MVGVIAIIPCFYGTKDSACMYHQHISSASVILEPSHLFLVLFPIMSTCNIVYCTSAYQEQYSTVSPWLLLSHYWHSHAWSLSTWVPCLLFFLLVWCLFIYCTRMVMACHVPDHDAARLSVATLAVKKKIQPWGEVRRKDGQHVAITNQENTASEKESAK